jgi:hypothetical protein
MGTELSNADGETDMTKLIHAFRSSAKALIAESTTEYWPRCPHHDSVQDKMVQYTAASRKRRNTINKIE